MVYKRGSRREIIASRKFYDEEGITAILAVTLDYNKMLEPFTRQIKENTGGVILTEPKSDLCRLLYGRAVSAGTGRVQGILREIMLMQFGTFRVPDGSFICIVRRK